jgi:hypothetical protein
VAKVEAVKPFLPAFAVLIGTTVLAVPPVSGGHASASAALNTLTATATDTTPPEDRGRRIEVTLSAQVLAPRKNRMARLCQRGRPFYAEWVDVNGTTRRVASDRPSSRSGRFTGALPLEYGGSDPNDPGRELNGDVPFGGGVFTVTVSVGKSQVLGRTGSFTCKPLSTTAQVAIPPSTVYSDAGIP